MTIGSYVPVKQHILLCKGRLDYRRKYAIFSENSEMSLTESEFLPSLLTWQLVPWAMATSAGWALSAVWRCPHLPTLFCTALKIQGGWKLILEPEGSYCPAQWVLWSSELLRHNGLNRSEIGPRVGQGWMLGRRWILPPGAALFGWALPYCLLSCAPFCEPFFCGCACTVQKTVFVIYFSL